MVSEAEETTASLVVGRSSVVGRRAGKGSEGGVWEGGVVGCVFHHLWVGYIGGFQLSGPDDLEEFVVSAEEFV